jgi:hypothetical protein
VSRPPGSPGSKRSSPGSQRPADPVDPSTCSDPAGHADRPDLGRAQDHRVPGPSEAGQNGSTSAPVGVRRVPHPGRDRKGPRRSTPPTRYPFPPSPSLSHTPPSHRWATRPSPLDRWPTHLPSAYARSPPAPPRRWATGSSPLDRCPTHLHSAYTLPAPAPSAQARWTDAPPTTPLLRAPRARPSPHLTDGPPDQAPWTDAPLTHLPPRPYPDLTEPDPSYRLRRWATGPTTLDRRAIGTCGLRAMGISRRAGRAMEGGGGGRPGRGWREGPRGPATTELPGHGAGGAPPPRRRPSAGRAGPRWRRSRRD